MIEKGRVTIRGLRASGAAMVCYLQSKNLLSAVFPNKVNDPICLRNRFMRAKGTFQTGIIGMSGGNMNDQSLGMKKLLLADLALERKMALVALHMIVHRVLILLCGLADATYKLSSGILLVGICHGLSLRSVQRLYQFFKAASRSAFMAIAFRSGYCVLHSSRSPS
jgi:hypothetical protein